MAGLAERTPDIVVLLLRAEGADEEDKEDERPEEARSKDVINSVIVS